MINKKILAVAIATAFVSNANAAIDMTLTADQTVTFASELVTAGDLNADGMLEATNTASLLDITAAVGFTIGDGTSKYVRINLTNATFGAVPTMASATTAVETATLSQGGAIGDSYVIFEVAAAGGNITPADTVTLAAAQLDISTSATASASYALYETAGDAVTQTTALATDSSPVAVVASGSTGEFTASNETTSTVASGFKSFDDTPAYVLSTTLTQSGEIDNSLVVADPSYTPGGVLVVATDLVTDAQSVTLSGDFSFGAWTLEDEATCADIGGVASIDVTAALNADENEATVAIASLDAGPYYLCNDISALGATDVVTKGSYSAELVTDGLSGSIGTFVYDTTSIEVPYLTTFASYNQRLYIVNNGSSAAAYTVSFTSEDGVTATAGTAATGTIPAGEMIAVKAVDIVTLTGKTRTSAVLEVEAVDADISATTQTVNLSNGGTDTVVLN